VVPRGLMKRGSALTALDDNASNSDDCYCCDGESDDDWGHDGAFRWVKHGLTRVWKMCHVDGVGQHR
jgi:hypothetical protein